MFVEDLEDPIESDQGVLASLSHRRPSFVLPNQAPDPLDQGVADATGLLLLLVRIRDGVAIMPHGYFAPDLAALPAQKPGSK